MGRWLPGARDRLERAAVELFVEQGFAATTVPQIAARAGLTTRTFFRHFADKREVLFAGDEVLHSARHRLAEAPAGARPIALLVDGLRWVAAERFEGRRDEIALRRTIIRSEPALLERDLRKRADLAEVVRAGLLERGVPARTAALLAETVVTVLHLAVDAWLDQDGDRPLMGFVTDGIEDLRLAISE